MPHLKSGGTLKLLKKLSILYVEDDPASRAFMTRYLERLTAVVIEACDGKAGLDLFNHHRPDIVISDIQMPNMDGIAMCTAIRKINPHVPIIITSAYNEKNLLLSSIGLGVVKYLIKPIRIDVLSEALASIAETLESQRQTAQQLQTMSAIIHETKYEQEKIKNYVAKYFDPIQPGNFSDGRYLNIPKGDISGDFVCTEQFQATRYLLIADGSGHGLAAVMPALQIPKIFHDQARQGFSLMTIAGEINRQLYAQHLTDHFVAITLVRLNTIEGFIEVLNCGNPPALLVDNTNRIIHEFSSTAPALGIVDNEAFDAEVVRINPGRVASLYVFTDGLGDTLQTHNTALNHDMLRVFFDRPGAYDYLMLLLQALPPEHQPDDITLLEINYNVANNPPLISPDPDDNAKRLRLEHKTQNVTLKKTTVLYVVNDAKTRGPLVHALNKQLGTLYLAATANEGLKLFNTYRPHVVIVDVDLAMIDGISLAQALRAIDRQTPIILASRNPDGPSTELMFELGVSLFLTEPINEYKALNAIIRSVEQREVQKKKHRAASVFHHSSMAITITDSNRNIIAVNPAFTRITGYSEAEIIGQNPRILSSGKHDEKFYQQMWHTLDTKGAWSGEVWNRRKNGELYLEWITINVANDTNDNLLHYVAVFADITERNVVAKKIQFLANYDKLTQLPNRALFMERLNQVIAQTQQTNAITALLLLNLDNFKSVNEALGQNTGDSLLYTVAQRLLTCVRNSDTVSRLGVDEFAILLPNIGTQETVAAIATKTQNILAQPFVINGKELSITASIGISLFPLDSEDAETLIRHADNAMRQVKRTGKNSFSYFNKHFEHQSTRYSILQQAMRKALRNNEFYLHYQPKYATGNHTVVGCEALVRWQNDSVGSVSPTEFIPIAEQTGFIIELSEWIIDSVCSHFSNWREAGLKVVPVSINISPLHFRRGNLINYLIDTMKRWRIAPQAIVIEVTEGMVMNNAEETIDSLNQLKTLGFTISIDDFGTGFSSLNYLCSLPVDELKIDRTFIMEIPRTGETVDRRKSTIPLAIIQLAKGLQLRLVAEGVETEEQKQFLVKHGCDIIQGYLFSQPLPADKFAALLALNAELRKTS